MKQLIKKAFGKAGFVLKRVECPALPGAGTRPIGNTQSILEDLRARGFNPRTILDVGANRGLWTRMALEIFPAATSVMIEPQEEMRESLEAVSRQYPGSKVVIAGAGRSAGQLELTSFGEDLTGSSFLPVSVQNSGPAVTKRQVPMVMLDSLFSSGEARIPELAKLDIQGFELEALAGGQSLLGRTAVIILETALFEFTTGQPVLREVVAFMEAHGYHVYDIGDYFRRPLDGAMGAFDIVFVHQTSALRESNEWR